MAKISLIHGDAAQFSISTDIVLTDPPFDMSGKTLSTIISRYKTEHLILITSMHQLIEFLNNSDWKLAFDFVFDSVVPKKSKNYKQPNYLHSTGVYLTKKGVKSKFSRKLRQRSDVFESNGYWPTIFRATRNNMQSHGMAKNIDAVTDLLGSFDVKNVVDPFAGSGTTGIAAFELDVSSTLIEINKGNFENLKNNFKFISSNFEIITRDLLKNK